jgi:hypothetical protein
MQNQAPNPTPAVVRTSPSVYVPTLRARCQAVVVLPTLNEELGLERTLSELPFDRFAEPNYLVQAVVVDGGSTDGTLEVARRWNIPVLVQTTKGKGAAVLEAIQWVRDQGIPHVAILDADATYPPASILPALNLLREGMDLVVGVRRPVGGPPRTVKNLVHRIGNVALSSLASMLSHRTILDICSGFWAVSTEQLGALDIGAAQFAIEAELVLKSLRAGLHVAQIPIEYRDRLGEAKIRAARDGGAILLSILEFGRQPRSARSALAVPGVPARELLSIGLIAETRKAVLEYPPNDVQLANRLGLSLHRAVPGIRVRLRPSENVVPFARSGAFEGLDPSCMLVSLPSPGAEPGAVNLSVLIRPMAKELTIRLPARGPKVPTTSGPSPETRTSVPPPRRPRSRYLAGLGTVTTRVGFNTGRQQAAILRANGFEPLLIGGDLAATIGARP